MKGAENAKDQASATALNEAMSRLSERCWSAAWLEDLELSLWSMLQGGPRGFGVGEVSTEELDELRRLSELANGWWRWSDSDGGEVFLSLDDWRTVWYAYRARSASDR